MNSRLPKLLICCTTVGTKKGAQALAAAILESRTAACVQIEGPIESHYVWKGQLQCEPEYRLWIKSTSDRQEQLMEAVRSHHPYEVPQIVAFEASRVDGDYLQWAFEQTRPG
ncbi:MAG: divalent-cation tolerance protein CutA [Planctomycetota bacterium]